MIVLSREAGGLSLYQQLYRQLRGQIARGEIQAGQKLPAKRAMAQQLNISGEELMERFVRGDASRNTEGSGLGLSIARSLVQLQGGSLEMTVDGDLFKVTLKFNIAQ